MNESSDATVSDVLRMMSKLEAHGLGDYVVTCNDEYTFARKGDMPTIKDNKKTVDFGGY